MQKTDFQKQTEIASEASIAAWAAGINQQARSRFKRKNSIESRKEWLRRILNGHNKDITSLWETFNEERSQLKPGLLSTDSASFAYLLGFHLFNYERSNQMLARLEDRYRFWSTLESRGKEDMGLKTHIIDLGCGSGALSQSLTTYVRQSIHQITLVDSAKKVVDAAKSILEKTNPQAKIYPLKIPVESYNNKNPDSDIDIYSLGYIWNELSKNKKAQKNVFRLWQQGLQKNSKTIIHIVDSAHQHLARSLMELKDQLSEMGYIALYPCPQKSVCPMLSRPKDWCYSNYHCTLPQDYVTTFDKIIGTQHSVLSTSSYFLVSPEMYHYMEVGKQMNNLMVMVGNPVNQDNQRTNLICNNRSDKIEKKLSNNNIHTLRGEVIKNSSNR